MKSVRGKSGAGVSFHLDVALNENDVWTTRGCMAFRTKEGHIQVSGPVMTLTRYGKPVKYPPCIGTPSLVEKIRAALEAKYGTYIVRNESGTGGSGLNMSDVDPDLPNATEV